MKLLKISLFSLTQKLTGLTREFKLFMSENENYITELYSRTDVSDINFSTMEKITSFVKNLSQKTTDLEETVIPRIDAEIIDSKNELAIVKSSVEENEVAISNKADSNHEHSIVTTGASGFMSNVDKTKLDGIETGANNYVHPNDANTRHVTDAEKNTWNNKADANGNGELDFFAKNITVENILPSLANGSEIGTPENRFKSIYVDEVYMSTNTLYIGDTPILGTDQDTINIKADPDQSITMKTSATGMTNIISERGVELSSSGMSSTVTVQATGANSQVNVGASSTVNLFAPNVKITGTTDFIGSTTTENLTVKGNLNILGDTTTVNTTQLQVKDNIIEINKGETGSGVTAGKAGLRVDRGEESPYNIIFDETDDFFKVGLDTSLEIIATRPYVDSAFKSHDHSIVTADTSGFMSSGDKTKLDGIATGANNYVHPNDANTRHITDTERTAWNGKADSGHGHGAATTSASGFMSNADKTKLDGIAMGANNYVHPNDANTRHVTDAEKTAWNGKAAGNHGHSNATTAASGFMSNTDKAKLDSLKQATFATDVQIDAIFA